MIYLDNNATTAVDPIVLEAMLPYFTNHFGNPSSATHNFGWQAREAVELARYQVATMIGAQPHEIIFTSCATESINLGLQGVAELFSKTRFICSKIEHSAVYNTLRYIEKQGNEISTIKTNNKGVLNVKEELYNQKFDVPTVLVFHHVNNELGVIQPIDEISTIAKKNKAIFMVDATQSVGHMKIDVSKNQIDMLCFSGHKIYGPKGVGVLCIRKNKSKLKPLLYGGGQEHGMRSGTLNVPAIVGIGKACELVEQNRENESKRLFQLRNNLENELLKIEGVSLNGDATNRITSLSSLTFEKVNGKEFLIALNNHIAVSSGSACSSNVTTPSHVLTAIGLTQEQASSTIRFGLGRFTTFEEIKTTIEVVTELYSQLKK